MPDFSDRLLLDQVLTARMNLLREYGDPETVRRLLEITISARADLQPAIMSGTLLALPEVESAKFGREVDLARRHSFRSNDNNATNYGIWWAANSAGDQLFTVSDRDLCDDPVLPTGEGSVVPYQAGTLIICEPTEPPPGDPSDPEPPICPEMIGIQSHCPPNEYPPLFPTDTAPPAWSIAGQSWISEGGSDYILFGSATHVTRRVSLVRMKGTFWADVVYYQYDERYNSDFAGVSGMHWKKYDFTRQYSQDGQHFARHVDSRYPDGYLEKLGSSYASFYDFWRDYP